MAFTTVIFIHLALAVKNAIWKFIFFNYSNEFLLNISLILTATFPSSVVTLATRHTLRFIAAIGARSSAIAFLRPVPKTYACHYGIVISLLKRYPSIHFPLDLHWNSLGSHFQFLQPFSSELSLQSEKLLQTSLISIIAPSAQRKLTRLNFSAHNPSGLGFSVKEQTQLPSGVCFIPLGHKHLNDPSFE